MPLVSQDLGFSSQNPLALVALFAVGFVASSINAVAGGGSLLSFPLLVAFGVPPLAANATNAVALWPGSLASAYGFRDQLARTKPHLRYLTLPTITGALLGAWLLTHTPERLFDFVVPLLVLLATLLLAFQARIRKAALGQKARVPVALGIFLQFLVSVYGGYFGAGMGIVMLAVFGLFIEGTLHELNAMKAWLGVAINLVASMFFLREGLLWLVPGFSVMAGAIVGGYFSARLSQRIDPNKLRRAIVVLGFAMTAWFFRAAFFR
ncbi:sulfite exporter TauE/SafE family protein [Polyangium sorediatum]|uniref:Probable membrane transporter protein n=1 Tax=Polyangium sorediatum TaxID=889274 RepID=A0ABT6NIA8_9BACT|nr:sulfite exporter TauE/SafE family protein [Polyangium sorediatum]MDI1428038.1 sulfite exporter TauE/SafE family protein [Polyangium sorediatum]